MRLVVLSMAFVGWLLAVPVGILGTAAACDQHAASSSTDDKEEACECGEDEDGECLPCPVDKKQEEVKS